MKKEKIVDFRFVCPKCGSENTPTDESNENWTVVKPDCEKCGEKLTLTFNTK